MSENYGPPPMRGPKHEPLAAFVGTWHAEGQSYGGQEQDPTDPRSHAAAWISDEVTVWHPGGFFIKKDEHAVIDGASLVTHVVIGWDGDTGAFVAHAFENHGFYRRYAVRADGQVWTFTGDTERARIEFSADGRQQTVTWEWRPINDAWLPLCDRSNIRVD